MSDDLAVAADDQLAGLGQRVSIQQNMSRVVGSLMLVTGRGHAGGAPRTTDEWATILAPHRDLSTPRRFVRYAFIR